MPPSRPTADRLAITALWMGIVAFAGGWLPILGLLLASVGIVLGIIALRRSNRRELAQIGLILDRRCAVQCGHRRDCRHVASDAARRTRGCLDDSSRLSRQPEKKGECPHPLDAGPPLVLRCCGLVFD